MNTFNAKRIILPQLPTCICRRVSRRAAKQARQLAIDIVCSGSSEEDNADGIPFATLRQFCEVA